MMFFHMLRSQLGDAAFIAGLRRFYRDNRFRAAGYDQRRAFEQASGRDLAAFSGLDPPHRGAAAGPDRGTRRPTAAGYQLSGRVEQTQREAPFPVTVPRWSHPVAAAAAGAWPCTGAGPLRHRATAPPLRLAVDPEFDLFRALEPGENPPSLSGLFGADRGLDPARGGGQTLAGGYRRLAGVGRGAPRAGNGCGMTRSSGCRKIGPSGCWAGGIAS